MNSKVNKQATLVQELVDEPWYRIGMVWLMIGLPAIVVVASLITVVIAHKNAPLLNTSENRSAEVSR